MFSNQLGRRNLTEEQRTYLLGKLYEARKHAVSNEEGRNQYSKEVSPQIGNQPNRVSEQIAKEQNIGKNTVLRAEKFSQGIDAIREVSSETADAILRRGHEKSFMFFREFFTQTSPIIVNQCGQALRFIHPRRIIPCLYHDRLADGASTIWLIRCPTADGTDIFIPPKQMCFPRPVCFHRGRLQCSGNGMKFRKPLPILLPFPCFSTVKNICFYLFYLISIVIRLCRNAGYFENIVVRIPVLLYHSAQLLYYFFLLF